MLLTLSLGEEPGKTLGVSQVNPGDRNSPEESLAVCWDFSNVPRCLLSTIKNPFKFFL